MYTVEMTRCERVNDYENVVEKRYLCFDDYEQAREFADTFSERATSCACCNDGRSVFSARVL